VPLVVGGVLGAVLLVQLRQPRDDVLDRRGRRQVDDQRAHLGAQEVVGAGRAQGGQARVLGGGQEVQDDVGVGEVPDLGAVGGRDPADHRRQCGRLGTPLGLRQRLVARQRGPEGLGRAPLGEEPLRRPDDLEAVGLALLAGLAPGGDPVAAEDAADRLRVLLRDLGHVQPQLEARPPPRHPGHPVAEALAGQLLAVGRGGQRDAGVGVQVVDVCGADQPVHRGVDRRRGAAPPVQAVVEGGDHLVLALDARVDVDQRAEPVQAQHRETGLGQRAEVTARALHPQQLDGLAGHRVGLGALGGGVPAGVVGVARVRTEPVAPAEQVVDHGVRHGSRFLPKFRGDFPRGKSGEVGGLSARKVRGWVLCQAPQPACWPPTRSRAMRSWYPERA
jgi:hypothetical protein